MMNIDKSPFADFTDRINKDLYGWTLRKEEYEGLIQDYTATLAYIRTQYSTNKVAVDLGQGILSHATRTTDKIVLRVKDDIYVEFTQKEAEKLLPQLIGLHEEKLKAANSEIVKIMSSMKEVEMLIQQYDTLV